MTFTPEVYAEIREGAIRSAAKIVPIVLRLHPARTVADVGCGEGWFAQEFARHGCEVMAIDREVESSQTAENPWFVQSELPCFVPPVDLAVCLEVAEHLPEVWAEGLVDSLVRAAPVVLFSAAIPGQGGHGHVNEQWPAYWRKRFMAHGFLVSGGLRYQIWNDGEIEPWYRQNLLVAASTGSEVSGGPLFSGAALRTGTFYPHPLVHPVVWEHRRQRP